MKLHTARYKAKGILRRLYYSARFWGMVMLIFLLALEHHTWAARIVAAPCLYAFIRFVVILWKRWRRVRALSILNKLLRSTQSTKEFLGKMPWKTLQMDIGVDYILRGWIHLAIPDPGRFHRQTAERVIKWFFWNHFGQDVLAPVITDRPEEVNSYLADGELRFQFVIHAITDDTEHPDAKFNYDGFERLDERGYFQLWRFTPSC